MKGVRPFALGALGIFVLGVVWELSVRSFNIPEFVLQPPSAIATTLVDDPSRYLDAAGTTLWHASTAILLSLIISVVVGSVLALSRAAEEAAQPALTLILVAPWVAYFSSLQVAFGLGNTPLLFLSTLVTIPAFTFAMVTGLRSVDPASVELFHSVAASRWEVLWRLRLPNAAPTLLATARFNSGLALAATYYAEGFGVNRGLGQIGKAAIGASNGEALWTTIVVTASVGFLFLGVITVLERTALRWHVSQRR